MAVARSMCNFFPEVAAGSGMEIFFKIGYNLGAQ